jgi:hypothetical protein
MKVLIILKNHQCRELDEVTKVGRVIHELYLRDRLNPFGNSEKVSQTFENRIHHNLDSYIIG